MFLTGSCFYHIPLIISHQQLYRAPLFCDYMYTHTFIHVCTHTNTDYDTDGLIFKMNCMILYHIVELVAHKFLTKSTTDVANIQFSTFCLILWLKLCWQSDTFLTLQLTQPFGRYFFIWIYWKYFPFLSKLIKIVIIFNQMLLVINNALDILHMIWLLIEIYWIQFTWPVHFFCMNKVRCHFQFEL